MCLWGEALALGPNLNAFDEPRLLASVPMAHERAQQAHALHLKMLQASREGHGPSPAQRDVLLTEALTMRYAPSAEEFVQKEPELRQNYAQAMKEVARKFDNDTFVLTLTVEALMNTHPWDYWIDPDTPRPETALAIDFLEKVLALEPKNGWAVHFYVHITEASSNPWKARGYARELHKLIPGSPHIVHMEFHTLMHTGSMAFSEHMNMEASRMERQVYPMHNLDTLGWLCRILGNFACASSASMRLEHIARKLVHHPNVFETGFPLSRFAVQYLFTLVAFDRHELILEQESPPAEADLYWWSIWHFARGVALVGLGNRGSAVQELQSLRACQRNVKAGGARAPGMPDWAFGNFGGNAQWGTLPVLDVLELAVAELEAVFAKADGLLTEAISYWRAADHLELNLPYDEPPTWYLPVAARLGAALLENDQTETAEEVYNATLRKYPNNGWAQFGLLQACQRLALDCKSNEESFHRSWRFADVDLANSASVAMATLQVPEPREKLAVWAPLLAISGMAVVFGLVAKCHDKANGDGDEDDEYLAAVYEAF